MILPVTLKRPMTNLTITLQIWGKPHETAKIQIGQWKLIDERMNTWKLGHAHEDNFDTKLFDYKRRCLFTLFLDFLKHVLTLKNGWMCEIGCFEANLSQKALLIAVLPADAESYKCQLITMRVFSPISLWLRPLSPGSV